MQQNIKFTRTCMCYSNAETRMSLRYSKLSNKSFLGWNLVCAYISNKKVQNVRYIFFSLGGNISYKCKDDCCKAKLQIEEYKTKMNMCYTNNQVKSHNFKIYTKLVQRMTLISSVSAVWMRSFYNGKPYRFGSMGKLWSIPINF